MTINIGTISPMGYDSSKSPDAEEGWLFCDGSAVSRNMYADLFAAIGTTWGGGDGQTTFNLPDLRGYFIRGVDDGAKRDVDIHLRHAAAMGGNQKGGVGTVQSFSTALPRSRQLSTDISGKHSHTVPHLPFEASWYVIAGHHYAVWNDDSVQSSENGDHTHSSGGGGDNESRCTNIYVDYVIYAGIPHSAVSIAERQTLQGTYPLGTVIPYGGEINEDALEKSGWLYCNGNTVSRQNFADLFDTIGTAYGDGDGSSTFNLPDFRGFFQRGVNGTSSADPDAPSRTALQPGGNAGNAIGAAQEYATGKPVKVMQMQDGGNHTHQVGHIPYESSSYPIAGHYQAKWNAGNLNTDEAGDHCHAVSGGDAETRPINVGCYFIIKYKEM